jgi:hypothetical protein
MLCAVVHRAASIRRKAGAENDAGVGQAGILHHTIGDATGGCLEQRFKQALP